MRHKHRLSAVAVLAAVAIGAMGGQAQAAKIVGTNGSETIRGTAKADVIQGRGGNDTIFGRGGNDRITPGAGRDIVSCGAGVDTVVADRRDVVRADCEVVRRPAPPTALPVPTPTPSPPPTPAPTPAPVPTPAPAPPALGTLQNPAPIGTAIDLRNGWRLMVSSVTPNANAIVAARNQFNPPPPPGAQFFMAAVMVTNVSATDPKFDGSFRLRAIGQSRVPYTTFTNSCGVIPNSFLFEGDEAYVGGTFVRNVCWAISTADAGSLILFDRPFLGTGDGPFFKLY